MPKSIAFEGKSRADLQAFPADARREAGFQLDRVQRGLDPADWKPMSAVGSGVCEIRIRDKSGIYRVVYVAKFRECVYVLHAFKKTTQQTSQTDIDLAAERYRKLVGSR